MHFAKRKCFWHRLSVHALLLLLALLLGGDRRVWSHGDPEQQDGDLLLCGSCGYEVASGRDLRHVASLAALPQPGDNGTLIGERRVPLQLFENPQGHRFRVITLKRAQVLKHWPADGHFSWFSGYSWTIATCPRCHSHLGWAFQPSSWPLQVSEKEFEESKDTFVALIIDKILQENFAATLLMVPKSFRS
ncbi:uncharacterized protein SI:CH211-51H9.7 [Latimeria chalumnae]|uniref:Si:ch211-51h9.7 n=1 Tax=Latimeria chalumnae TaxID=7897 RepID=H3B4M9_LATCH|nr:PREDICTED: uncharacterized protein LOC106702819 [Latimeria chalumnae]|eukprot:XP_014341676.1 PREDICTED: uncharacterized protein LOC106702819 [Latimeria chalumnae]